MPIQRCEGYHYIIVDVNCEFSDDLFTVTQPVACDRLMSMLDEINGKYGRGAMRTASVPRIPIGVCVAR